MKKKYNNKIHYAISICIYLNLLFYLLISFQNKEYKSSELNNEPTTE